MMTSSPIAASELSILTRVISIDKPMLSHAVAKELLSWGFSESDKNRMSELAAKARQGNLTDAERDEADGFERVTSFLGLVKSKARRTLREHAVSE